MSIFEVEDRDAGLNGIVTCSIVSDAFELQPLAVDEYKVIVVRRLDRESEPVHNVTIQCDDAGSPPMSDSVNFVVKVRVKNVLRRSGFWGGGGGGGEVSKNMRERK